MDQRDLEIIELLQNDGKLSYAEIGEKIDLSISAVKDRIKKLIHEGVLMQNVYLVNPAALGLHICAFVQLVTPDPLDEPNFKKAINLIPEVLECHSITGEFSYLLKVRVKSTQDLEKLLSEKIKAIKGVTKTNSMITLTSSKENTQIDVEKLNVD
jgi:Lrp/AsnC family transcriptional regulator, leucine-responsive regulatory protein